MLWVRRFGKEKASRGAKRLMILRDVMMVAQGFDPDHPRKRFRGPSGHRVHLCNSMTAGIGMSAFAWWGVGVGGGI